MPIPAWRLNITFGKILALREYPVLTLTMKIVVWLSGWCIGAKRRYFAIHVCVARRAGDCFG